jgi:hypothetical protein
MEVAMGVELFLYVHFEAGGDADDTGPFITLVTVPALVGRTALSEDAFVWMKQKVDGDSRGKAVIAALHEAGGHAGDVLLRMLTDAFELGRQYKEGHG